MAGATPKGKKDKKPFKPKWDPLNRIADIDMPPPSVHLDLDMDAVKDGKTNKTSRTRPAKSA